MNEIMLIVILLLMIVNVAITGYGVYNSLPSEKRRKLIARKASLRKKIVCFIDSCFSPFVILLSYLVPKNKKLILFMGRQNSGFLDNVKYLYLYLYEHKYNEKYEIIFVGHNDRSLKVLNDLGFKTVNYKPSIKVYGLLLRANLVITDNAHWTTHNRYNAALKATKIQLWHGIGFKKIRLTDDKFKAKASGVRGFFTHRLTGQLAIYDEFLSTSEFFTNEVFAPSFLPKNVFTCGYPRNDSFLQEEDFAVEHKMVNVDIDVYNRVRELKALGKKIVLYTPTFRKAQLYKISSDSLDFERLSKFGEEHNIVFVFKLHPLPQYKIDFSLYSNVIEYNNRSDVYPLFQYVDMMITDYSSIYMDYLLLDRPCLFFIYDFDYYIKSCRDVRSDFMELAPGAKCRTQNELFEQIHRHLVENIDDYKEERRRICGMSWEYQGGNSCEKAWNYIEDKYLSK